MTNIRTPWAISPRSTPEAVVVVDSLGNEVATFKDYRLAEAAVYYVVLEDKTSELEAAIAKLADLNDSLKEKLDAVRVAAEY